jgi:hypothetical protein
MALTETQEKELLDGSKNLQEQLKTVLATIEPLKVVAAKVPELEKSLAEKDAKIAELAKGQSNLTQDAAFNGLKSKYPDVPESVLKALPEAQREPLAKELQDQYSKVKPTGETDPMKLWADAGGIAPATEAERVAQDLERKKEYEAHSKTGNISGMLHQRMGELVSKVIAPAFKRS